MTDGKGFIIMDSHRHFFYNEERRQAIFSLFMSCSGDVAGAVPVM